MLRAISYNNQHLMLMLICHNKFRFSPSSKLSNARIELRHFVYLKNSSNLAFMLKYFIKISVYSPVVFFRFDNQGVISKVLPLICIVAKHEQVINEIKQNKEKSVNCMKFWFL